MFWKLAKLGESKGREMVLVETAEMEGDKKDVMMKQ